MSNLGYTDTPFLPGGQWRVHDSHRPQPRVVSADPVPSDAIVLFDGTHTEHWRHLDGSPCRWEIVEGAMQVVKGAGDITSMAVFGNMQLHLEFKSPTPVVGDGQGRGNSGVFLMGRYEIQVLDNHQNPTYADGTVGSVYGEFPPLVNASRPAGEWQTYDILWQVPLFDGKGKCVRPAYVTVLLNGIVVQNHTALLGATSHRVVGKYEDHSPAGPIKLQDHGDPVAFRNIWVRPL